MGVNPDIEEAFALRGWCDASGAEQSFQANSNSMPAGLSSGGFNRAEMRNLNDAKESRLGSSDKVDYFSTQATIMQSRQHFVPCSSHSGVQQEDHPGRY
jgi:replication factor A1